MENLEQSNNKNVSLSLIAEYSSESDSEDKSNENPANDDSDTVELSEMVLKNNIINACAHGPLSSTSNEEVTRHMIIDSCENDVLEYDVTEYRDADTSSESDTDEASDSDEDSIKDIEELTSGDEVEGGKADKSIPKVKGELGLDDLPPIEDLAISLPAQETTKIGTVASVVDRLVVVRAFPETPAVDLDTVLFLDNGAKALGKVFDVFGPVTEPHYCVRFNSEEHVKERGVSAGMDVYIAPRSSDHTNYVFLTELMKTKGSDASWLHDIEPPPNQVEFSDDEEERRANRARKEQRQRQDGDSGETSKNQPRKILEAKRNRPTQSSSRFGPNRGRMPVGFRRNPGFRPQRPWDDQMRTPPPHPDMGPMPPFQAFPPFGPPHMNRFNFGRPMRPNWPQHFRQNAPVFGASFCNMPGPQPQWTNDPPPPGT
ncbi:H/ACA ribonucleoprotein complex non-core subunit NAF1 [Aricia agestis]|uniref:H/ACA ribonucleoprotein complex non-core subunit NAF1 n=1 Tax=Aricia agestis TaxID=91739 RepID=UPI001C206EB0|nr:H/ACA ribonucleoprotein complex non-core subunit NAF1 [Aricia agestis]